VPDRFFLSYSSVDGEAFVLRLVDPLIAGRPPFPVWFDKRELRPGEDWDEQIVEAIRACSGLLFVMTTDSVRPDSICKDEWVRALKYKKPVIPLRFDAEAELPFRLGSRHFVDFTDSFEEALAQLRQHLAWMDSPAGGLQALRYRLADAERELPRTPEPSQQARIKREMQQLQRQIAEQQAQLANPQAASQHTMQRIDSGLEREREPERRVSVRRAKFVNPPPVIAPNWFQDRHVETGQIGDFLKDDALRLLTVVGRGGVGKTAMVCRLLKALEGGHLPDDLGPLGVDGIVYLSPLGRHKVNFPNLFADLTRLLPQDTAQRLDQLYQDPRHTTKDQTLALLEAFPSGRTVLLLDNFEDVVDPETLAITESELDETLQTLLTAPQHGIKVIVTTRVAPRALLLVQPAVQRRLNLDEGLESPFAENILRAMDPDGTLGLKETPEALLTEARERTRGYPRALEALVAILAADRDTSLPELLVETGRLLPENVVEVLVGEAFNRLDPLAQQVMQALAIYGLPVPPVAVDYLLQPYRPTIDSAPVLSRLVNMQFVRRDAGRYYLHQIDCEYALSRIPQGQPADRDTAEPRLTRYSLLARGAGYFEQTRTPRESWKQLGDLAPQLAEFELRYQGEDYDTAAAVLLDIDMNYLQLWGHYRLMVQLHERLQGRITDSAYFGQASTGNLGGALLYMGRFQEAIARYLEALVLARLHGDRRGEGAWLGSLGNCYSYLGEIRRAIDYYEQALTILRDIGNRQGEANNLANMGYYGYRSLGQLRRAIDLNEQALAIYRDINDREGEATVVFNLSKFYADLGEVPQAIDLCEQALVIARDIGGRYLEAYGLVYMGDCDTMRELWEQAILHYNEGIGIADELGNVELQSLGRSGLATAELLRGELGAAYEATEDATKHYYPMDNAHAAVVLGVILLRQGHADRARLVFTEAITRADTLLEQADENFRALDDKALALCGLALLGHAARLPEATAALQAARAVTRAAGVVIPALRLLDALAVVDRAGILAPIRAESESVTRP
jgi:tetratricopeptide (TPR) repeat protein